MVLGSLYKIRKDVIEIRNCVNEDTKTLADHSEKLVECNKTLDEIGMRQRELAEKLDKQTEFLLEDKREAKGNEERLERIMALLEAALVETNRA